HARRELPIALFDDALLGRTLLPFPAGRLERDDAQDAPGRALRLHRTAERTVLWLRLFLVRPADGVLGLGRRVLRHRLQRGGDALGSARAEQRIQPGHRASWREALRRAVQLLGVVALAAHARRGGALEQISGVALAALAELGGLVQRLLGQARVVLRRLRRWRIDDVFRQRSERGQDFVLLLLGHLELVERADKVFDQRVELFFDQLKAGVRRLHVTAGVLTRPARRRADELDEQTAQANQIRVEEAAVDPLRRRDAFQELVDDGFDRRLAAQAIVKRLRRCGGRRRLRGRRRGRCGGRGSSSARLTRKLSNY